MNENNQIVLSDKASVDPEWIHVPGSIVPQGSSARPLYLKIRSDSAQYNIRFGKTGLIKGFVNRTARREAGWIFIYKDLLAILPAQARAKLTGRTVTGRGKVVDIIESVPNPNQVPNDPVYGYALPGLEFLSQYFNLYKKDKKLLFTPRHDFFSLDAGALMTEAISRLFSTGTTNGWIFATAKDKKLLFTPRHDFFSLDAGALYSGCLHAAEEVLGPA